MESLHNCFPCDGTVRLCTDYTCCVGLMGFKHPLCDRDVISSLDCFSDAVHPSSVSILACVLSSLCHDVQSG